MSRDPLAARSADPKRPPNSEAIAIAWLIYNGSSMAEVVYIVDHPYPAGGEMAIVREQFDTTVSFVNQHTHLFAASQ